MDQIAVLLHDFGLGLVGLYTSLSRFQAVQSLGLRIRHKWLNLMMWCFDRFGCRVQLSPNLDSTGTGVSTFFSAGVSRKGSTFCGTWAVVAVGGSSVAVPDFSVALREPLLSLVRFTIFNLYGFPLIFFLIRPSSITLYKKLSVSCNNIKSNLIVEHNYFSGWLIYSVRRPKIILNPRWTWGGFAMKFLWPSLDSTKVKEPEQVNNMITYFIYENKKIFPG
jgi:hypothetical protein